MVQAGPAASEGREGNKVSSMLTLQEISTLLNNAGEIKMPCACSEFPEGFCSRNIIIGIRRDGENAMQKANGTKIKHEMHGRIPN